MPTQTCKGEGTMEQAGYLLLPSMSSRSTLTVTGSVHVSLPHSVGAPQGQRPISLTVVAPMPHTQDALEKCGVDGRIGGWMDDMVIRPVEACLRKETFWARFRRAGMWLGFVKVEKGIM